MTPDEEGSAAKKAEVLAHHLDATVVTAIASTFTEDTLGAITAWDRALVLGLALEDLPLEGVDRLLQTTASRLAALEDVREEVPGSASLLRRHRAPGRARRPATALHRIVTACGKACASAIVASGATGAEHRRPLLRAFGAVLAPGTPPPEDQAAVEALVASRVVDWETAELLEAAAIAGALESK